MKKIKIDGLDEIIYEETLDNGLRVFMHPNKECSSYYITFNTKFGSIYNKFKYEGDSEFISLPNGTAHFLEHLTFKMKDGDASSFFASLGANSNAYTSTDVTCYEVSSSSNFKETLELLIDMVQSPFYNEELVENEKGIIIEEVNMYEDNPKRRLLNKKMDCYFHKDKRKLKVAGDVSDVKSITLDDINKAYEYFYNPSNMFIVITGGFDYKEAIKIIKDNQSKKEFIKKPNIVLEEVDEPDTVVVNEALIVDRVGVDKCFLVFKYPLKKFEGYTKREIAVNMNVIIKCLYSLTSELKEELIREGLITENSGFSFFITDTQVYLTFNGDTNEANKIFDIIIDAINNVSIKDEDILRMKKVIISNHITAFDDYYNVSDTILNDIVKENEIFTDSINLIKAIEPAKVRKFSKLLSDASICKITIKAK